MCEHTSISQVSDYVLVLKYNLAGLSTPVHPKSREATQINYWALCVGSQVYLNSSEHTNRSVEYTICMHCWHFSVCKMLLWLTTNVFSGFYYKSYGRGDLASHCWYTLYTTDSVNLLFMFIAIWSLVGIAYMPHAPMTHN